MLMRMKMMMTMMNYWKFGFQKAMSKLIRGGELELAVSIGRILSTVQPQLSCAVELLARRCERLGLW